MSFSQVIWHLYYTICHGSFAYVLQVVGILEWCIGMFERFTLNSHSITHNLFLFYLLEGYITTYSVI